MPGKIGNEGNCKYANQTVEEHAIKLKLSAKNRKEK